MIGLCRLYRGAPDAIEADLSRYHNHRMSHPGPGGPFTFTEVAARLRYLPGDSATKTFLRDGEPDWTLELDMQDEIRQWLMVLARAKPQPHPDSPASAMMRRKTEAEAGERALAEKQFRQKQRQRENQARKG